MRQLQKAQSKILWLDTETTGLDPMVNDVWQIAGLVEIDGEVKESFDLKLAPLSIDAVSQEALDLRGMTREQLAAFPSAVKVVTQFKQLLGRYVNKFDKDDKFVIAGYYVRFDIDFLRALFTKLGDKYFGSWFFNAYIDVSCFVALLPLFGLRFDNFKLSTLCADFGIALDAHDALEDVKATRALYESIKGVVGSNGDR